MRNLTRIRCISFNYYILLLGCLAATCWFSCFFSFSAPENTKPAREASPSDALSEYLRKDLLAKPFPEVVSIPSIERSCPCCGHSSHVDKWRGWGKGTRRLNRPRCPICLSVERHRLACLYLKRYTDYYTRKQRVLEFTPFSRVMQRQHDYSAGDINPDSYGTEAVKTSKIDITDIPFEDNVFDVIFVSMILEHVIDERKAVVEVMRVLKQTGFAIFAVPIDFRRPRTIEETAESPNSNLKASALLLKYGQQDHVRLYGRDVFARWASSGCNTEIVNSTATFTLQDMSTYVLDVYEDLYLCRKMGPGSL